MNPMFSSSRIATQLDPSVTPAVLLAATAAVACLVYVMGFWVPLGLLLAVGGLLLMFARPEWATLIVLFAVYTNLVVVVSRFHGLPQFVGIGFFLLLGLPLAYYLLVEHRPIVIDRPLVLMFVYLVVMLASMAFSHTPAASLVHVTRYIFEGIVFYFLLVNTLRTRSVLRRAIWTIVLAGALMGMLSLYQHATGSYSRSFGGLAQVTTDRAADPEKGMRLDGPIGQKNRYAQILIVLLPLTVLLVRVERSRQLRAIAVLAGLAIVGGMVLTYSRGVAIGMIVLVGAMVLAKQISRRRAMLAGAALVVGVVLFTPRYVERLSKFSDLDTVFSNRGNVDTALRSRASQNLAALHIFADNPLLGIGAGQAPLHISEYANRRGYDRLRGNWHAHSMYLEELANTGLLGFVAFMAIVAVIVQRLVILRRQLRIFDTESTEIVTAFLLAIVAYLATALFAQLAYQRYYWLLLAMAAAAARIVRTPVAPAKATS